jgi:hypothetical protein
VMQHFSIGYLKVRGLRLLWMTSSKTVVFVGRFFGRAFDFRGMCIISLVSCSRSWVLVHSDRGDQFDVEQERSAMRMLWA